MAGHSVTLTWNASAVDATHDAPTGYNVKRATVHGGPYTQIGSTTAAVLTYVDTDVIAGTTYFYEVEAFNANGTAPTPEVSALVPFHGPNAPTNLVASAS